ncbi:pseudoazurin [Celeribacter indicus]|uniref:Pseudoazurin n=1 Tax=Celeribacter indicus TaxID=1208324 RepID=A0A0B5DQD1_9RHOB|nr:pseudoazurin [Celeribacter indicus]AJE45748.1 pseudoazurin [Celeribacter indicus]SDX63567.1 pseudoazurin [Celeribacter indicus]
MKTAAAFLLTCLTAGTALAETHEVGMYTRNDQGPMIYEPQFLAIAPGDSVRFVPAQPGHNAAVIDGMIPEGAEPFKTQIDEDVTVTLTEPGLYGIKCSPHYAMGMVMLIEVGGPTARELPEDLPDRARQRFEEILEAVAR